MAQVLRSLPKNERDDNLLVGLDHGDDGGVYRLTDDIALIQSLDFFTPIVDDPYMFGQIAAANALSDIYAMGGMPKTVLNIVAFPIKTLGPDVLADILRGSNDKVREAGAIVVGGHSIEDDEPKFGLSVTGIVHPNNINKNIGAEPGDMLVLTKPLGVGIMTTALKRGEITKEQETNVTDVMRTLNKRAAEVLTSFKPHAVTDVTGFGLLGHAFEMAHGSDVSFILKSEQIPLLQGTVDLAERQFIPGGSKANYRWLQKNVSFASSITESERYILSDAITSGGLLISLPKEDASEYVARLTEQYRLDVAIIGEVVERKERTLYVS